MFLEFVEPLFWGSEKSLKFPAKIPPNFPPKNRKNHRRASAGAQGEHVLASTLSLRTVGPAAVLSHNCDIPSLVEELSSCARQSLTSTVSVRRIVAAR